MLSKTKYILLNVYHIVIDGLYDSVPIILAFMALSFGDGEKAVGLIVSLGSAAATVAGLGTLFFSRRLGFSRTVCCVTALYGLGFFAAAFSGHMVTAGLCFVVAVAGHNVFHNIAFSYLTAQTERRFLGKTMSDFTAIGDIGRIPLVSLAGFAAAFSLGGVPGWRTVSFAYGAMALLAAAGLLLYTRRANEAKPAAKPGPKRHFPSFSLLRERELALAMTASCLNACSNDRIFTFLPLLLLAKGVDPAIIGTFALGFTVGSFLGKTACGRMIDAFGPRRVFIVAELMLTALLLLLIISQALALIVGIALLLGVVTKGTVPVIQTIITQPIKDNQHYDDIFSINTFTRGIINMATPLLFGLIAAATSMEFVYCIMAAVAALAVIPVMLMRSGGHAPL